MASEMTNIHDMDADDAEFQDVHISDDDIVHDSEYSE